MMSHEDQFEEWMEREVFRPCQHRTKHLVEVPKYGIVKLVTEPETIPVASDDIVRIVIETLDEKKIRVGLDEALERFHETKYFYVDEEELQDPQVAAYLQVTKRHVHLAFRGRHISETIQSLKTDKNNKEKNGGTDEGHNDERDDGSDDDEESGGGGESGAGTKQDRSK